MSTTSTASTIFIKKKLLGSLKSKPIISTRLPVFCYRGWCDICLFLNWKARIFNTVSYNWIPFLFRECDSHSRSEFEIKKPQKIRISRIPPTSVSGPTVAKTTDAVGVSEALQIPQNVSEDASTQNQVPCKSVPLLPVVMNSNVSGIQWNDRWDSALRLLYFKQDKQ
jgi:hypothetical protein